MAKQSTGHPYDQILKPLLMTEFHLRSICTGFYTSTNLTLYFCLVLPVPLDKNEGIILKTCIENSIFPEHFMKSLSTDFSSGSK